MTDKLDKFPEENRTFETRLLFIRDLFAEKYSQLDIMKKCIEHKLDRSYLIYIEQLEKDLKKLQNEHPTRILKSLKK